MFLLYIFYALFLTAQGVMFYEMTATAPISTITIRMFAVKNIGECLSACVVHKMCKAVQIKQSYCVLLPRDRCSVGLIMLVGSSYYDTHKDSSKCSLYPIDSESFVG